MITYQPKPLTVEDWSSTQQDNSKPMGTWYSPIQEKVPAWRKWCEWEGWSPGTYTNQYQLSNIPYCNLDQAIKGTGQNKVLLLSTEEAVWDLTRKFQGKNEYCIRWDKVAGLVSGIEINPFQYGLRFCGARWYSGWDMASGCIWQQPEGMVIKEMPLDWDGSVKSRSWNWDDDEDCDNSED